MSITNYEHLSAIESVLQTCYHKLSKKQMVAIQRLIATGLNHCELLLALGKAGTKLTTRQIKQRGVGGGMKKAWVVEIGVTHTISKKNPNGTYSKKKFKTPHEARLASLKYAEEIKRMIQSYKETKLTDEQWLEGLEYFDRSGRKKGSGS